MLTWGEIVELGGQLGGLLLLSAITTGIYSCLLFPWHYFRMSATHGIKWSDKLSWVQIFDMNYVTVTYYDICLEGLRTWRKTRRKWNANGYHLDQNISLYSPKSSCLHITLCFFVSLSPSSSTLAWRPCDGNFEVSSLLSTAGESPLPPTPLAIPSSFRCCCNHFPPSAPSNNQIWLNIHLMKTTCTKKNKSFTSRLPSEDFVPSSADQGHRPQKAFFWD